MAVTAETLRLINGMRIRVDRDTDDVTRQLVIAWSKAWADVVGDWDNAIAQLQALNDDGKWPSRGQIIRANRAQAALRSTYDALQSLTDLTGVHISTGVDNVVDAAQGHVDLIASQYPPDERTVARNKVLVRADPEQIKAIVGRTNDRVTKTLFPLPGDAGDRIRATLVRGVSQGANPKVVARRMVDGVRKDFNQALTRAMNIARTEMLDAHRAAAGVVQGNNADVLAGWEWGSALDRRTCPACFGMHGTQFPLTTPGPDDHQCGRCQRIPVTKSWADLGFPDLVEPASLMPDASTVFDSLSWADQLNIMGQTRLDLYDAGSITLSDLVRNRTNPGWRDSIEVTPLKDLV